MFKKAKLNRDDHAMMDKIARIIGPIVRVILFPIMFIIKLYKWTYDFD